jgi:hypothetical protein
MTTSAGTRATLAWRGSTRAAGPETGGLSITGCVPNEIGLAFYGHAPAVTPFMGGEKLVADPHHRMGVLTLDANGAASYPLLPDPNRVMPGETYFFQFWTRDPANPAGFGVALSNAVRVAICP